MGQQISSKLIIPFVQCSFLAFYLFRTITPSFPYSLYCTPYELEQRTKHERDEMDSVVMLHRAEMDIKLREERAVHPWTVHSRRSLNLTMDSKLTMAV